MSHPQQRFFVNGVNQFLPDFFKGKRILEIGSLNINGSVRDYFTDCDYLGLDVAPGKDVDEVCFGENYGAPANTFDTVISCEAMEHNLGWKKTWLNMLRLVKNDGLVIMTCATLGRKQHGTENFQPEDSPLTFNLGQNYYKNLCENDFNNLVNIESWFSVWGFFTDNSSYDLYFFGVGHDANESTQIAAKNLKNAFSNHYYKVNTLGIY